MYKSIGSIQAQTEQDFEIVAVDDGSTDNSLEILNKTHVTIGNTQREKPLIFCKWFFDGEKEMRTNYLCGGRGGMSSASGGKTGLFGPGGGSGKSVDLFPSRINRINSTGDIQRYNNRRAGQYTFTKGTHFKADAFKNAMHRAMRLQP